MRSVRTDEEVQEGTVLAYTAPAQKGHAVTVNVQAPRPQVVVTYPMLQDLERLEEEANRALMDCTDPLVPTLDYNKALDDYREIYLRVREVATLLGEYAATRNGNQPSEVERISKDYAMLGAPRLDPVKFCEAWNFSAGYCSVLPIPDDYQGDYTSDLVELISMGMGHERTEALREAVEAILSDFYVWGIPKPTQQ